MNEVEKLKKNKLLRLLPYLAFGFMFAISIALKITRQGPSHVSEEYLSQLKERKWVEDPIFNSDKLEASLRNTTDDADLNEDIVEVTKPTHKTLAMKVLHIADEVQRVESIEEVVGKTMKMSDEERKKYWSEQIKKKIFKQRPSNPDFIFHNKLPKSGSTTMNAILLKLSRLNKFNFRKLSPVDIPENATIELAKFLKNNMKEPYILLKHHHLVNFSKINEVQPTYINVVREPTSWFASKFYFERNGWERNPVSRTQHVPSKADTIERCIQIKDKACTSPTMYLTFFCGMPNECSVDTPDNKRRATEMAKYNALHTFYVIGVLEKFEETLQLFEILLPRYYRNDIKAWNSHGVQFQQTSTKTVKKKAMSDESKKYLMENLLKEECELYDFIMEIFNTRLQLHAVE